jgi:hypothetical protein
MAFKVTLYLESTEAKELQNVINASNLSDYLKDLYCATIQENLRNYQIVKCREIIHTIAAELTPSAVDKDNMLSVNALEEQIAILKHVLT